MSSSPRLLGFRLSSLFSWCQIVVGVKLSYNLPWKTNMSDRLLIEKSFDVKISKNLDLISSHLLQLVSLLIWPKVQASHQTLHAMHFPTLLPEFRKMCHKEIYLRERHISCSHPMCHKKIYLCRRERHKSCSALCKYIRSPSFSHSIKYHLGKCATRKYIS